MVGELRGEARTVEACEDDVERGAAVGFGDGTEEDSMRRGEGAALYELRF